MFSRLRLRYVKNPSTFTYFAVKRSSDTAAKPSPGTSDKYQRILDAAIEVIAQKGFFHSRVSEIADRAGVADGTIYLYFKNKDELLMAGIDSAFHGFIGRARHELSSRIHGKSCAKWPSCTWKLWATTATWQLSFRPNCVTAPSFWSSFPIISWSSILTSSGTSCGKARKRARFAPNCRSRSR